MRKCFQRPVRSNVNRLSENYIKKTRPKKKNDGLNVNRKKKENYINSDVDRTNLLDIYDVHL